MDNIIEKIQRKKTTKEINEFIKIKKLPNLKLEKYSYKTLKHWNKIKKNNEKIIKLQLDSIELTSTFLENIRYIEKTIPYLKTKEDYIILDKICYKYNDKTTEEYLENIEIKSLKEITIEDIDKYIKEHNKEEIKKILSNYRIYENDTKGYKITTVTEANTYIKIIKYISSLIEKIKIYKLDIFKLSAQLMPKLSNLFNSIDIDNLTKEQKENLEDNVLNHIYNDNYLQINNIEDLNNYKEKKLEYIKTIKDTNKILNILLYNNNDIINSNMETKIKNIQNNNNNLKEILEKNKQTLSEEDYKAIEFLIEFDIFDNKNYINIYLKYKDILKKVNIDELNQKIRILYGQEISKSLTKIDNMEDLKQTEIDGIKTFTKEYGNYRLIVHAISPEKKLIMNQKISSYMPDKTFYEYPEYWDKLPKEIGTYALSCSYISQTEMPMFTDPSNNYLYYCFDELDPNDIRNISIEDGGTSHENNKDTFGGCREKLVTPDLLLSKGIDNKSYNEVAFNRYNKDGSRKKPKFILCFNEINEASIKHAKYHNIPILLIKTDKYIDDIYKEIITLLNKINENNKEEIYIKIKHLINCLERIKKPKNYKYLDQKYLDEIKKLEEEINSYKTTKNRSK